MFTVKMNGKDAVVTRTLDLPAQGILKAHRMSSTFKVNCDLGIGANEPTAKAIYEDFLKRYRKDLEALGKSRMSDYTKLWKEAERDLGANMHDKREYTEISKDLYSAIDSKWKSFNRGDAIKSGQAALDAATAAAIKAGKANKKEVKPKVKLGDKGNETDRKSFLTSILAVVAGGAVAGPVGAAVAVVPAAPKALLALQKIRWRGATDAQTNAAEIQRDLKAAKKAMDALTPSVKLLKSNRANLNMQIIEATKSLKTDMGALADAAKANKANKSVAVELAKAAKSTGEIQKDLAAQAKAVEKLGAMIETIEAAQKAVDKATELAETEIKGWTGLVRKFETISNDTNTVIGTINTLIKTLK